MTRTRFVVITTTLLLSIPCASRVSALPAPADPGAYGQQYGWDVPPQEFNEVQRRGYHDGVQGARKDYGNGRRPNVNNREEYRDPDDMPHDIPRSMRDAYRDAFRRGYREAAERLWGGVGQGRPGPPPGAFDWEWGMRGLRDDAARQGYMAGTGAARNDFQANRPPDPDDRPNYRNPPVPPEFFANYRAGFMRGYTVAFSKLSGDPDWQVSGDVSGWQPPSRYSEIQRRAFHEGIEGAHKDFGNHRIADPNNRDEYRRPPVPEQYWSDYRRAFRRGYEMAALRLYGD